MNVDRLTLAAPCAPLPPAYAAGTLRHWCRRDVRPERCVIRLGEPELDELHAAVQQLRRDPLPTLLLEPSHFDLPRWRAVMARVKAGLDEGIGIAVIDRLPLDALDPEEAKALFWCVGQLLGRTVAQKWDGTMLYDVADRGLRYAYGVRGSYTNVELVFHTDNAFGLAPPDYVGLLCLRPARAGGVSRFCSLAEVHDRLHRSHPRLLKRLYEPMLWDRQAEHAEDAPKVAVSPMFRFQSGRLAVRANPSLVRRGYELTGEPMDAELDAALDAFRDLTEDPALWFELPIERGQLQYLNNVDIAHYRGEFRDDPSPARKRHLVRTWHRDSGRRSYDGV